MQSSTVVLRGTPGPVRVQVVPARGVTPSESTLFQVSDPGLAVFVIVHRTRSVPRTMSCALPFVVAPLRDEE